LGYRRLRIWSAGCSTGEEPYTLAMILLETLQARPENWQIEIIATDINEKSLAKARQGLYAAYSLRNVSRPLLDKYFTPAENNQYLVREAPRALVSFQHLNLFDERRLMFLRGLDVILCCNVLIYFDAESKRRMIQHFYNMLQPHGYFFLGHAESLFGINDDFRLVHFPGATAYARSKRSLS
jgi:chemotaxis protein methyltransferase CheR